MKKLSFYLFSIHWLWKNRKWGNTRQKYKALFIAWDKRNKNTVRDKLKKTMVVDVSKDFTMSPGGRYKRDGKFSGEEFRSKILEPKFLEAKKKGATLEINLDGGYGYPTSFLDEAFGGLARKYGAKEARKILTFISEEEPALIKEIPEYINSAKKGG